MSLRIELFHKPFINEISRVALAIIMSIVTNFSPIAKASSEQVNLLCTKNDKNTVLSINLEGNYAYVPYWVHIEDDRVIRLKPIEPTDRDVQFQGNDPVIGLEDGFFAAMLAASANGLAVANKRNYGNTVFLNLGGNCGFGEIGGDENFSFFDGTIGVFRTFIPVIFSKAK